MPLIDSSNFMNFEEIIFFIHSLISLELKGNEIHKVLTFKLFVFYLKFTIFLVKAFSLILMTSTSRTCYKR